MACRAPLLAPHHPIPFGARFATVMHRIFGTGIGEIIMAESAIDYSRLFAKGLPAASGRWNGFAKYNFIGGHNNPDEIPVEGLIEA
jgi:hypothetical protein